MEFVCFNYSIRFMKRLVSKRWMMTLLVVMGFGLSAVAQSISVSGRAVGVDGVPCINVKVMVKGTPYGAMTNIELI